MIPRIHPISPHQLLDFEGKPVYALFLQSEPIRGTHFRPKIVRQGYDVLRIVRRPDHNARTLGVASILLPQFGEFRPPTDDGSIDTGKAVFLFLFQNQITAMRFLKATETDNKITFVRMQHGVHEAIQACKAF